MDGGQGAKTVAVDARTAGDLQTPPDNLRVRQPAFPTHFAGGSRDVAHTLGRRASSDRFNADRAGATGIGMASPSPWFGPAVP